MLGSHNFQSNCLSLSLSVLSLCFPLWLKGLAGVLWRNEFIFSEFPGLEGMKKTGMWACSLVGRDDKLLFFLSIFLSLWICPELYGRVFTPRRFFSCLFSSLHGVFKSISG